MTGPLPNSWRERYVCAKTDYLIYPKGSLLIKELKTGELRD